MQMMDQIKLKQILPHCKQHFSARHSSENLQDPLHICFQTRKSTYISALPVLVASILLVIYSMSFLLKKILDLEWMKNFVKIHASQKVISSSIFTPMVCILFFISLMGFIVQLIGIIYPNFEIIMVSPSISWAFSILVILARQGQAILLFLPAIFLTIFLTQIIILIDENPYQSQYLSILFLFFPALLSLGAFVVILFMPIRDYDKPNPEISPPFSTPSAKFRSPEDNLTVWQFMSVSWIAPLLSLGKARQLNDEDVWSLGYEFKHYFLFERFRELEGSVLVKLLKANALDLCITSTLGIIQLVENFIPPVLLMKILQSVQSPSSKRKALIYAFLMLVVRWITAQTNVFNLWYSRRVYERSRGEMIIMLYEKTLSRKVRSSNNGINEKLNIDPTSHDDHTINARQSLILRRIQNFYFKSIRWICGRSRPSQCIKNKNLASTGKIINLMRFDAYEVAQRFWQFDTLITQPFNILFSVILIWHLLGWPCVLGATAVILAQLINALLARILIGWERKLKMATDVKLQHISQFVEAIRHLRYYAWQDVWLRNIMGARHRELGLKVTVICWNILIDSINLMASGFFPVLAFWAYTRWYKLPLRVEIIFPALQLFFILESSLSSLPAMIMQLLRAKVSLERLDNFMLEPNVQDSLFPTGSGVQLKNATFAWPDTDKPVLYDLNLSFQTGINLICGEVGAGKSTLLQALLGELDQLKGESLRHRDMIGYCGQTPWLQSMSIRDNILFSAPYEETRYQEILESCALLPDLANFKYGDLSMVGENGIGLSGGQKARISLARAVYSKASFLLLDDPLSSLDYQTAELIVQRCLAGPILLGRTVVLVTHRTELCLEIAKQIILISEGKASIVNADDLNSHLRRKNKTFESVEPNQGIDSVESQSSVPNKFIEDEFRSHGSVQTKVYWEYIRAGDLKWWFALICVLALYRLIKIGETLFLKQWSEAYGRLQQQGHSIFDSIFKDYPSPENNISPWLISFSLLTTAEVVLNVISRGVMLVIVYKAGKTLFEKVMVKITYAKFRFYDITPVGRLMNRLTSDINTVDGNISDQFHDIAIDSISWLFSLITIGSITPLFLILALGLTWSFASIFLHFLPTSQSLRRLEMASLSPLISNFGAVSDGLTTIRAYCASSLFLDQFIALTDNFQKMDHFYWSVQAWLMYRLEILSAISTFTLTVLAIYLGISAGLVAFVLTASSRFVSATHGLCQKYGQLQLNFVSVERVVELLDIPQEEKGKISPPASWPRYGSDIIFEDVSIKYAPHLETVLSNISLTILGSSTTALTGRTGSGKSTLVLALLGTLPLTNGRIIVDGLDLATIDLQVLRSRISFLAQDPILFPGTLMQNLDPISQYNESECEAVITAISAIHDYGWSLQTPIDAGGRNMSQGQRQLVGLARILLRRSPIVILDEVTASLNFDMAEQVQNLLREWLSQSTILVIAHRPEAVRDANIIVRMANKRIIDIKKPLK